MTARKSPAKAPPAKRAAGKRSVPAKKAAPKKAAVPEVTQDLEIRHGNRIVFLQPVTNSSFDLSFKGGNLVLKASLADATPEGVEEDFDFSQPVDAQVIAATGVDPDEEVEVNPNVIQTVHTGDRESDKK